MCYYGPLCSGLRRNYNTPNDSFWCCTGTGVENHGKYGDSIYFHSDKDLYVNLFISSDLTWKEKSLKLRQEKKCPDEMSTKFEFTCEKPIQLRLHLRHPFWATGEYEIKVN